MENKQEAIDRIREFCSVYEDCNLCPHYVVEKDSFVCDVNREDG